MALQKRIIQSQGVPATKTPLRTTRNSDLKFHRPKLEEITMNIFNDDEHKKAGDHAKEAGHQSKESLKDISDHALEAEKTMKDQAGEKLHSAKEWAKDSGKEMTKGASSALSSAKERVQAVPSALKKGAQVIREKMSPKDHNDSR